MSDKPGLAQEIDKQMSSLPFAFDSAKLSLLFHQKAAAGVSPADYAKELIKAFEAHETARFPNVEQAIRDRIASRRQSERNEGRSVEPPSLKR